MNDETLKDALNSEFESVTDSGLLEEYLTVIAKIENALTELKANG
jgi:hypothetical protein